MLEKYVNTLVLKILKEIRIIFDILILRKKLISRQITCEFIFVTFDILYKI